MIIFEKVKALVDVPTAARHYGVEVKRSNMAICPFHHERTPSCKLYERNYHCFGCGAHGDVIQLVQELFGLTPMQAVRQLNSDFGLGLDASRPPDRAEIDRIQRKKQAQVAYANWEHHAFDVLHHYVWTIRDWSRQYAPSRPEASQDARFVYALHHAEYAEHIANEFMLADKEERLAMKEEIDNIEKEIRELSGESCRENAGIDTGRIDGTPPRLDAR